jgi:hypothetical protein
VLFRPKKCYFCSFLLPFIVTIYTSCYYFTHSWSVQLVKSQHSTRQGRRPTGQGRGPSDHYIELLGVSFDRKLTTKPHAKAMLVATKQRAAVIARLVNHILRGRYLRQLAMELVNGKLCLALAAYATPGLPSPSGEAKTHLPSTTISSRKVDHRGQDQEHGLGP